MVLLIATARILSALETVPSSSRKDLNLPDTPSLESHISHEQLIQLARYLRTAQNGDASWSLNSLLKGTKVYVPPPPKKPEPSPEYLASKARLLAAAEADAYKRLMTPSTTSSTHNPSPIFTATSASATGSEEPDTITPSLVLNIFLSVVITGFSVYWALTKFQTPEFMTSSILSAWGSQNKRAGASEPVRVLISFLAALAVGVAEVFIYATYLGKIERARGREKKFKERKVVIGSEEVGGKNGPPNEVKVDSGDQETIWGRGTNGGVRRRVRERWEEKEKSREDEDGDGSQ